jgi:hypothetical protein
MHTHTHTHTYKHTQNQENFSFKGPYLGGGSRKKRGKDGKRGVKSRRWPRKQNQTPSPSPLYSQITTTITIIRSSILNRVAQKWNQMTAKKPSRRPSMDRIQTQAEERRVEERHVGERQAGESNAVQPPTEQEDAAWAEIQATPDDPGVEEVPPAQPGTHATIKLGGEETIQVMTRGRCFRYLSRTPYVTLSLFNIYAYIYISFSF